MRPDVLERAEGYAQGEPEVDGLLEGVAPLRQVREGAERLLKGPCGLTGSRPRQGLLPRLAAVRHGLVPHLPPQGMVGQPFHLLGQPVPGERLQGRDDAGVPRAPLLLEQHLVGHLLGEGVRKGVRDLREEARLVEELGRLQVGEAQPELPPQALRPRPGAASGAPRCR